MFAVPAGHHDRPSYVIRLSDRDVASGERVRAKVTGAMPGKVKRVRIYWDDGSRPSVRRGLPARAGHRYAKPGDYSIHAHVALKSGRPARGPVSQLAHVRGYDVPSR